MADKRRKFPTSIGRWVYGQAVTALLIAAWFIGVLIALWLVFSIIGPLVRPVLNFGPRFSLGADSPPVTIPILLVTAGLLIPFIWWVNSPHFKRVTASTTAPLRLHERMAGMGAGGSAAYAGLLDEWDHLHGPGAVLLGQSLYDGGAIGLDDDRGLLTIAASRSGKGRSVIIPNLLLWEGSAVVIDPKGTNAAVTAARRGAGGGRVKSGMGHTVHVLDPFQIVQGAKGAAFNPLSSVDIFGLTAKEDIGLIADALVVPGSGDAVHWDEGARLIISGVIAHLLTRPRAAPATLLDVRAVLKLAPQELAEFFAGMLENDSAGGLAQAAAAFVLNAGPNERGGFMTTIGRNTSWLDSVAMARAVSRSDFNMADVKEKPTTIYVVLPPHLLGEHSRFMRLFVNLTVRAASVGGKSKVPVLLIMDEFYSLGTLNVLASASGLLAGLGLRLWPIVQNITQLRELYPKNWQTFFANAGAVQVFGVNDRETADEVVSRMGRVRWSEIIDKRTSHVITNLIEAPEIEQATDRGTGIEFVLVAGKPPLVLRKTPYDISPMFNKSMYNPDPDHKDS